MAIISFLTQIDYQAGDPDTSIARAAYDALAKKGHASDKDFYALLDSNADGHWDTAYELSETGSNDRLTTLTRDDTSADPVKITATGRVSNFAVGDLTNSILYDNNHGFGIDNKPDQGKPTHYLNSGDAIDFALNSINGHAQVLQKATFTVNAEDCDDPVAVYLDFDKSTLVRVNNQWQTNSSFALTKLHDNDVVVVDFVNHAISVNGHAVNGVPASFWSAYAAYGQDNLTIGSGANESDGFSLANVTLTTAAATSGNHVAVIGDPTVHDVTEDTNVNAGNLTAAGSIAISDADQGQASFQTTVTGAQGNLGSLSLAANGSYTYSVGNSAVQYLGAGDSKVDTFTVTSVDGTTKQVSFTIHGTNDTPVIGGVSIGNATEDSNPATLTTGGALSIADADQGQSNFTAQAATAGSNGYGSFTLDAAGNWTYTADNTQAAIQQLGDGQSLTDSFSAASSDGTASQIVTVTIYGTNDVPVIGGIAVRDITEDSDPSTLATSGALTIADADQGQSTFAAQVSTIGSNGFGSFTLDASGNWTYAANNTQAAIQQLGDGQTLTDSFTAVSSDGTASQIVTVTIQGTNDAPVITGGDTAAAVQEDNNPLATGHLNGSDVDHGATLIWSVVGGQPVNADFVFAIDEFKVIKGGSPLFDDSFSDGLAPPNAPNFINGTPTSYGVPTGATFVEMLDHAVMYGPLGPAPAAGVGPGAPIFVSDGATLLSSADQSLGPTGLGLRIGSTFSVEGRFEGLVPDEAREGYGIRLTDRNLPAVPSPSNPTNPGNDVLDLSVRRDADGHLAVQFRYLDFQHNTNPVLLGEVALDPSAISDNQVVLRLNHNTAGTTDITASFDIVDHDGNLLSTNIIPGVGHIFSDENWTRAQFVGSEPVENVSYLVGQYGALTIDQQGDWKYMLFDSQPNVQALAQGETATDTFQVRATDEYGAFDTKTVNITVTGQNDAPVITGGVSTGAVQEDGVQTATGTLTATDVDHGATKTWSIVGGTLPNAVADYHVQIDNFHVTRNGSTFFDDPFSDNNPPPSAPPIFNGNPTSYSAGTATLTEAGGRAIMDGANGSPFAIGSGSGHFVALNSNTSNLPADLGLGLKIDDDFTVEGRFDLTIPGGGENYGIRVSDANGPTHPGDDVIQFIVQPGGPLGGISFGLSRLDFVHSTVTPISGGGIVPAAGDDQIVLRLSHLASNPGVITASYQLLDNGIGTSSGTLPGTAQIFGLSTPGDTSDDELYTRAMFVAGESTSPISTLNGQYGSLSVNQNGTWTYNLANGQANVQALAQGESVSDTFQVQVTDEHGASATQTVNVAVTGTNDAPVITGGQTTGTVQEDGVQRATGTLTAVDVDHGATKTWNVVGGNAGHVTNYSVTIDEFKVVKTGSGTPTTIFDDPFTNSAPPISPLGQPAYIGSNGQFTNANGRAVMDDEHAGTGFSISNPALDFTGLPTGGIGNWAQIGTNVDPSSSLGLKSGTSFTISGVYDLTQSEANYGIRLANTDGATLFAGNDVVDFNVRTGLSGLFVQLTQIDFVGGSSTPLQMVPITLSPGDDQILLQLTNDATGMGTNGTIHASFSVLNHGVVDYTANLTGTGHLFDHTNWTRAGFEATAPGNTSSFVNGTYGALAINQSGNWTYQLDNSKANVQALAQGESVTDTFQLQVTDEHGAFATQTVNVAVTGTNDAPVITGGQTTGTVQEDGVQQATGTLTAVDVDHGATKTWNVVGGSAPHLTADYHFQIDDFRIIRNGTVFFDDTFSDNNPPPSAPPIFNGNPTSYSLSPTNTITEAGGRAILDGAFGVPFAIGTGLGHFPTLNTDTSTDLSKGLKEGDDLTIEGRYDLILPKIGENYGIRFVDSGGTPFQPGDDNIALSLTRGADGLLRVNMTELDFVAGVTTPISSVLVNPAAGDDQIVLRLTQSAANPGVVTGSFDFLHNGVVTSTGSVPGFGQIFGTETPGNTSDDEVWTRAMFTAGDNFAIKSTLNGTYGSLTVNQNGTWTYQLANGQANVQALAQGETVTDSFQVQVTDEHGAFATQTVNVAVTGTNDAPVITGGATTGSVKEDQINQATGQLTVVDVDHNATQSWTVVGGTPSGTADYHFLADSLTVTKNNGALVVLQDDFSDGLPPPNSPPLNPFANGGPSTPTTYGGIGGFTESGGKLHFDSNNAVSFVGVGTNDPIIGQDAIVRTNVDFNPTGQGLKVGTQFTIKADFDLVLPDSPREAYGIRATDRLLTPSTNADSSVTPAQLGDNTFELVVRQNLSGQDVVALRHLDFATDVTTNLQSIALNAPVGADQIRLSLSHNPNDTFLTASFQYLSGGSLVGAAQNFTVTAPVFTPGSADTEIWTRADIVAYAPQFTDSIFGGSYGTLDIGQSGAWTYSLNNGLATTQSLAEGQHASDVFSVKVADQFGAFDTKTITIDVVGTNDAPVIQLPAPPAPPAPVLAEDSAATLLTSAIVNFSDVDLADTHSPSASLLSATYSGGALPSGLQPLLQNALVTTLIDSATGDGHGQYRWDFALANSAVQFLGEGQSLTLTYQTTVTDSSPFAPASHASASQNVTITITGTNDGPVAAAISADANEDTGNPVTLAAFYTDADAGDTFVFSVDATGTHGHVVNNGDGTFSYDPNGQFESLPLGATATDSFSYTVTDSHGASSTATATVTIHGENDTSYVADGTVTPAATKAPALPNQLVAGSGIPSNHFGLAENDSGIELGMQVIYRQGPAVTTADTYADGVLHFNVNSGTQSTANGSSVNNSTRAAWSVDYSIATGLNGQTTDLSNFTFKLLADVDPGLGTSYHTLELVPGGGINGGAGQSGDVWVDDNLSASGLGSINGHPIVIADDAGSANVTQNSENYAFSFVQNYLTSAYGPGNNFSGQAHFDLVLEAFQGATMLADNHIVVDVNARPAPPAPMSVSNFTTLTYPVVTPAGHGAAPPGHGQATDINNAGVIVGLSETYDDGSIQGLDGWVYSNGAFTTVHIGNQNAVSDINSFGVLAGSYSPGNSTPRYGFIENGATVTTIDLSPNGSTDIQGINDAGNFVGSSFLHAGNFYSGFANIGGVYTYLNPFGSNDAHANGINNLNDVIGTYNSGGVAHSFLDHNGVFTNVDKPGGLQTIAVDINNAGQIGGYYQDSSSHWHGYIETNGVFTTIDNPLAVGSGGTAVNGINDAGQVVGAYYDAANVPHAFVATINNPIGQSTSDVLVASPQGSTLVGGAGNDTFVFNAAPQTQSMITDFSHGQDVLQISAAGFGHGLAHGVDPTVLPGAPASASNGGTDGNFIFDNTDPTGGTLYWDATGGSGADATPVVKLQAVTSLLPSDFHVV